MPEFLFFILAAIIIVVLTVISKMEPAKSSLSCKPHKWRLCDQSGWLPDDEEVGTERWRGAALACMLCGNTPSSDPRPNTGEY